jgi:DNA-binding NarL/FixJ family response regulator
MIVADVVAVAFVDDHPVLLEGVGHIFARNRRFRVVGKGATADAAREIAVRQSPDLIFVDLSMPGEIFAVIKEISGTTRTKVLVYTASNSEELAVRALDCGASAFVLKDSIADEIFSAAEAVLRGELFISQGSAARVFAALRNRHSRRNAPQTTKLSQRERQVISLLLEARSNKEIANNLSISEKTVKHYMTNLMTKLNARNRVEVALAAKQQLREAVDWPGLKPSEEPSISVLR